MAKTKKILKKNVAPRNKRVTKIKKENPYYSSYIIAITELNRIYYTTKLSKDLIQKYRADIIKDKDITIDIEIPSIKGSEIIKERRKGKVSDILKKAHSL